MLECNVGIVCCCMPYVRSLLNRVFPNCFGGTFFSSGGGKKGQKYHTMTSTTADGGTQQKQLQQETTNATATTTTTSTSEGPLGDEDDVQKVPKVTKSVANPTGPRKARSNTFELMPIEEGALAKYPEW